MAQTACIMQPVSEEDPYETKDAIALQFFFKDSHINSKRKSWITSCRRLHYHHHHYHHNVGISQALVPELSGAVTIEDLL